MQITVKYTGKNFFGFNEYMECTETFTEMTARKAIAGLKKDQNLAVHISEGTENTAFYYDSWSDFDNGVVTVHHSQSYYNIDAPVKMSFSKARKLAMDLLKKTA